MSPCPVCGGSGCDACGCSGCQDCGGPDMRSPEYGEDYSGSNPCKSIPLPKPPPRPEKEELDEILAALYDYLAHKEQDPSKLARLLARYKALTGKDKPAFWD